MLNRSILKAKPGQVRSGLSDFPCNYHCAIIGTCLNLQECRKLLKKARVINVDSMTDYNVHTASVRACGSRKKGAYLFQKHLDKKYKKVFKEFGSLKTREQILEKWEAYKKKGLIAAAFWSGICHPVSDEKLWHQLYEDVHMLSHIQGRTRQLDAREVDQIRSRNSFLESQVESMSADVEREVKKRKETEAEKSAIFLEKKQLQGMVAQLQERNAELLAEKKRFMSDAHSALYREVIQPLEHKNHSDTVELRRVKNNYQKLQQKFDNLKEENLIWAEMFDSLRVESVACDPSCTNRCDNPAEMSCPKKILIVGGTVNLDHLIQLEPQLKTHGLMHHNGFEDSQTRLIGMVKRADAVLCPIDQVSHRACLTAKRECKAQGKPIWFLRSSGLSSLQTAILKSLNSLASDPLSAECG
ncbi:MAG: hypothetical protein CSA81_10695 [Acidobacteria bacterium]|nr:MAG: hypothetical protein CSA81_10695 [Acidobacteriota bacterium]